jgi:hypothetical protein
MVAMTGITGLCECTTTSDSVPTATTTRKSGEERLPATQLPRASLPYTPDEPQKSRSAVSFQPVDRQVDGIFITAIQRIPHADLKIQCALQTQGAGEIGHQRAPSVSPVEVVRLDM